MEYNKNDFQKMNDKKVLHKVRKHWVVVSLAMLMALGGTAAATHVSANADATTSNSNAQSNTQTPKENQGQSLVKSANNDNASAQNNNQAQLNNKQNASQNITSQASQLHQRILSNVMANQKPANNQLGAQQNGQQSAPKVSNHVSAPKVGANQSANGRGLLGERINNSLNDAAANKVTTNVNRRKLALTNPKAGMNLGDSATDSSNANANNVTPNAVAKSMANPADVNSNMVIHYLNTHANNREINETSDMVGTNANKGFNMSHYLNVLPEGYVLDTSYDNYNGHNYNQSSDYPNTYVGGHHDLTVYLMPAPQAVKGYVRFNYISSDNVTQNAVTSSDDESTASDNTNLNQSDVQGYLNDIPSGYNLASSDVNYTYTDNSGQKQSDTVNVNTDKKLSVPFTSGVTNVNIKISQIKNPNAGMAEGTITYEDATNGNNVVGSTPFRETAGQSVDLSNTKFEDLLPSGYEMDNNVNPTTDSTWENGDNDIIYVQPDGTNPNVPKAQPGYSFITVNYVDSSSHKVLNQFNLTGKDGVQKGENDDAFSLDDYKNALPTNYHLVSTTPSDASAPTKFPKQDGADDVVTVNVALNDQANPKSKKYNPSTVQNAKYASPKIEYVDVNTGEKVGDEITLSDVPAGSVINYGPYVTNLPSNGTDSTYNFVNMGPHETNASNMMVDPSASNGVDKYANIIYVKSVPKTAQPITVNYINQNGLQVSTANATGALTQNINVTDPNDNPKDSTVPSGYALTPGENVMHQVTNQPQTVDVTVAGQTVKHSTTVKKTTVDSDGNPSTVNVPINGVDIKMARNVSDGKGNTKAISDYSDVISNPVAGQEVVIDPSSIAPAGYSVNPGQSPITYQIQSNGGTKVLTPTKNVPTAYNYTEIAASKTNSQGQPTDKNGNVIPKTIPNGNGGQKPNPNYPYQALVQPITVQFVNQNGKVIPTKDPANGNTVNSYQLKGNYNNSINVVDPYGTSEMPEGYHLNGDQNVTYTFTDNPQTANVLVAGYSTGAGTSTSTTGSKTSSNNKAGQKSNSDSSNTVPSTNKKNQPTSIIGPNGKKTSQTTLKNDQVAIHQIFNSNEGVQSDYHIVNIDGEVGNSYTIAPNEVQGQDLIPSDYVSSNQNQNYTATVNPDGTLSIPGATNNTVTYNYNKRTDNIIVKYEDQSGNVVQSDTATGEIGDRLPVQQYQDNVPNGYMVANFNTTTGTSPLQYKGTNIGPSNTPIFSDASNNSVMTINLMKASTINIVYYNVTANKHDAIHTETVTQAKDSSGQIQSNYTLPASDTELVPAGYSFDGVVEGATKDGSGNYTMPFGASNNTIGIDVTKNQSTSNSSAVNSDMGTVTVHYINSTNTNDTNSNDEVDEMSVSSDLSKSGQHMFDPSSYAQNVPYGYDNYSNGTLPSAPVSFAKGNKDYYVYVQRNNTPLQANYPVKIEYDDVNNGNKAVGNGITLNGKANSQVNIAQYESELPSGYQYVGLGQTYSTFAPTHNGQTEVEHILVSKPAPSYGKVTVNYINSDGNIMPSDTIVANGKNGSSFDMSNYENSVPLKYSYKSAGVVTGYNNGKPVENANGFIDYFNGGNQTLNIHVYKTPKTYNYSTITAIYKDANGVQPDVKVKETGRIGDVFDVSPFEHSCPEGTTFDGVVGSIPSFFPQHGDTKPANTTVTFNVTY